MLYISKYNIRTGIISYPFGHLRATVEIRTVVHWYLRVYLHTSTSPPSPPHYFRGRLLTCSPSHHNISLLHSPPPQCPLLILSYNLPPRRLNHPN